MLGTFEFFEYYSIFIRNNHILLKLRSSLVAQMVKCLPAMRETRLRKIIWRRKCHPTPVLLPGKSHGRRNIVGYSPWGHKESDRTERLHSVTHCKGQSTKDMTCVKPQLE